MAFEESEGFSEILKSNFHSVVLLGAANVGKTATVYRYVLDELPAGLTSTIGVEFTKRVVTDKETAQKIQLHIWDTAGQERFKSVTKHYYRGADACLLIFDLTSHESFDEVPTWLNEIKENTPPECTVCLVGNKADLTKQRQVEREAAMEFARGNNLLYRETSAFWKRDSLQIDHVQGGIDYVFESILKSFFAKQSTREETPLKPQPKVRVGLNELYEYHSDSRCEC